MVAPYVLGVDFGTSFTAAALGRGSSVEPVVLGTSSVAMPSVIYASSDGTTLVGESAVRKAVGDPECVARGVKRRLADSYPIVLDGVPYEPVELVRLMFANVLGTVSRREGVTPRLVVTTHPASFSEHRREQIASAARGAGASDVVLLSEPEAAAISYASKGGVEPGENIAVYDLGGGTFDVSVLRASESGFEIVGRSLGMERFGGEDFDEEIFNHVDQTLAGAIREQDTSNPAVVRALTQLRADCRTAKEHLSEDTSAVIPVMLPGLDTEVQIQREEFEGLIRSGLLRTIEVLRDAVRGADLQMRDISRVLLVGGSSQIPLVAETVRELADRPVSVDVDPKMAIAGGAALHGLSLLAKTPNTPATTTAGVSGTVSPDPDPDAENSSPPEDPEHAPAPPVQATTPGVDGPSTTSSQKPKHAKRSGRGRWAAIVVAVAVLALGAGMAAWAINNGAPPPPVSAEVTETPLPAELIESGDIWAYDDSGSDLGTAWREEFFDDSGWRVGPTEIGYGDGDEATVLDIDPNSDLKPITTYFRKTFDAGPNGSNIDSLELRMKVDDGTVVYLNGQEIWRENVPMGRVNSETLAINRIKKDEESEWLVTNLTGLDLKDGENLVAVEIHQKGRSSSDITFDLELTER